MTFFRSGKQKQTRRQPDQVGRIDNLGVAVWLNRNGDHDVKIGEAVSRGRDVYVRTVLPLSMLPEACSTIRTVAETFSNEKDVPSDLRETLRSLAERLDLALGDMPPAGQLNGGQRPGLYGSA